MAALGVTETASDQQGDGHLMTQATVLGTINKPTHVDGVPDREDAIKGMAHFAGGGPAGTTCGGCAFRGLMRVPKYTMLKDGDAERPVKPYRHLGCRKYFEMTNRYGIKVDAENRSCKYYEVKT
jgi:hypothetical protein